MVSLGVYGLVAIAENSRRARVYSLLVSAAGALTFGIHGYFLMAGYSQFRLPVSIGILVAVGLVALAQLALELKDIEFGP